MARPGIMIYFDILEPIKMLPDEDKGKLLVAMLEYGKHGIVPDLSGPLGIVWSFVQPMIDKDEQRYDDMKLQREYAAFCKKRKRIWMPKVMFDEWVLMSDDERQRAVDPVMSRNPTTTAMCNKQCTTNNVQLQPSVSNTNLQSPDNSYHSQEPMEAAAAAESILNPVGGVLGQGVVFLTDEQTDDLLEKLGLDVFDHYVKKLATFIIKNDASVKNHYETILKWWRQDCGLAPE